MAADVLAVFRLLAARREWSCIGSEEVPPVADRALCDGIYTPAIHELSLITAATMAEVGPLLDRAIVELGGTPPTPVESAWMIVRHCAEHLAGGGEGAESILGFIRDLPHGRLWDPQTRQLDPDIGTLREIAFCYDSPLEMEFEGRIITDERERRAILDRLAREEAAAWLRRHPPPDPRG